LGLGFLFKELGLLKRGVGFVGNAFVPLCLSVSPLELVENGNSENCTELLRFFFFQTNQSMIEQL
jgi:hypothetical protein